MRTILNLTLVPRVDEEPAPPRPGPAPIVSVIIPARNEARAIEGTLRSFCAQTHEAIEIIVVNDRSDDGTGEIARRVAAGDPRVVVVDGVETPPEWLGKPWALQQGADRARGEWLLFVDADVRYAPPAVEAAVRFAEAQSADLASLFPNFEMVGFWERLTMPILGFAAFTLVPSWLSNRSRLSFLGIGGGCGNLIRRSSYDRLGQHHALAQAVIDDVALAREVRRNGGRTAIARGEHLVSLRMYHGRREIIEGFTKNSFIAMGRRYVPAGLLLGVTAVGNFLPFALALSALFTSAVSPAQWMGITTVGLILVTRLIVHRSLGYEIWSALLAHPLFVAFWLYVVLRSIWYTGVRGQLRWRGRTYDASRTRFGAD